MRLSELTDATADALRSAGAVLLDLMTPTRPAGRHGAGALRQDRLHHRAGAQPRRRRAPAVLRRHGRGPHRPRLSRAAARRQPSRASPTRSTWPSSPSDPPQWPESTRRISQLRVTIEYAPATALRRALGPRAAARRHRRLSGRVADRPAAAGAVVRRLVAPGGRGRAGAAAGRRPPRTGSRSSPRSIADAPADEQVALTGAGLFTRYLQAARAPDPELTAPGPGRFLLPGDLAGSPLLTFFPLPPAAGAAYQRGTLGAMLARRFESYKTHVVKPFFRDHFARLDRQIVLIDALSAVNAGAAALADLQRSMEAILKCFRPGANTWLSGILARRIDRLLFAATKADHLHHTSHDRLEAILRLIADKAIARAAFAGAEVKVMALAALQVHARGGGAIGPAAAALHRRRAAAGRAPGRPGCSTARTEAAVFPGDLPEDPASLMTQPRRRRPRRCQRPFPALPAAAHQPRDAPPARSRPCRTSASTGPSSSCWGTGSHERRTRTAPAACIRSGRSGHRRGAARDRRSRRPQRRGRRTDADDGGLVAADARRSRAAGPALGRAARLRAGRRGGAGGRRPGSRASSPPPWCARTGSAGPRSCCCWSPPSPR